VLPRPFVNLPNGRSRHHPVRGQDILAVDSLFAQTLEQLAGHHVLDCVNLDEVPACATANWGEI
jgi:hypothetical protein